MSDRPTLVVLFEKRFAPASHVLQSANRAMTTGMPEEITLACLLHEALEVLWGFVGEANRYVDAEQPWSLARAAKEGDGPARARLAEVLGDGFTLREARRHVHRTPWDSVQAFQYSRFVRRL